MTHLGQQLCDMITKIQQSNQFSFHSIQSTEIIIIIIMNKWSVTNFLHVTYLWTFVIGWNGIIWTKWNETKSTTSIHRIQLISQFYMRFFIITCEKEWIVSLSLSFFFVSISFTLSSIKLVWTVCVLLTFIPIHTIHTIHTYFTLIINLRFWWLLCCASLYWILLKFYSLRSIGGLFLLLLICVFTWRMMIIFFLSSVFE